MVIGVSKEFNKVGGEGLMTDWRKGIWMGCVDMDEGLNERMVGGEFLLLHG